MANLDVFSKTAPCTPPIAEGITFAADVATGLWKGTGLDTTVNRMTGAGMPFYSAAEVKRFRATADSLTTRAATLAAAQVDADAKAVLAAAALAGAPMTTAMANLTTATDAVVTAQDFLTTATINAAQPVNGKFNPFI